MINRLIQKQEFPELWMDTRFVLIPKAGTLGGDAMGNECRPI